MQRDYLVTPSLSSLMVACVNALHREVQSSFALLCRDSIMKDVVQTAQQSIKTAGEAATGAAGPKIAEEAVKRVSAYRTTMRSLDARPLDLASLTRDVQAALKERGFDPGPVDGIAGTRTTKALQEFQKKNGLAVTGQADAATLQKLGLQPT
jgi:peptidoglycan hydrolase-like protein with peptidoglycan-binding domain